jgi:hypothetical protein
VSARNRVILSVYVSPLDAENAVHRLRMAAFWRMAVFNPVLEHQGSRFGADTRERSPPGQRQITVVRTAGGESRSPLAGQLLFESLGCRIQKPQRAWRRE